MTTQPNDRLHRGLRARHLNMIAIGGAIGTGLPVASGATISQAGPGGALLAYTLIGAMVFFLMQSPGEMATYSPVAGSFGDYGTHYVSPRPSDCIGLELLVQLGHHRSGRFVAAALVMRYWFPNSPAHGRPSLGHPLHHQRFLRTFIR